MNKKLVTLAGLIILLTSLKTTAADSAVSTAGAVTNDIAKAIMPSTKNCSYVDKQRYQPFSDIDSTFPGASTIGFVKGADNATNCINVSSGGTESLIKIIFNVAISAIIILTVFNISVSGIQYMTEEAVGKKGAARKKLTESIVALLLGLSSYTILYTVNQQLINFSFNPGSIDTANSILGGIVDANIAALTPGQSTSLSGIESKNGPQTPTIPPGYSMTADGILINNSTGNPLLDQFGGLAPVGDTSGALTNMNGGAGSVSCSGSICSAGKPTVFGYLDGDGTVGNSGDNGIGNALWSDKAGCTYDTGNTYTQGLALPKSFWGSIGLTYSDVKYVGIALSINGQQQAVLPIVDDSQQNLDFTFAAARLYLDPTITNSNRINTAGKKVTFQVIKDYYRTNPKLNVAYIIDDAQTTGSGGRRNNIRPCNK